MTGRLAGACATLASTIALVLVGTGTWPTLLGGAGLALLLGGLVRRRIGAVTLGCTGSFAALLFATASDPGTAGGLGSWSVVAAGGAIVLAWTTGRTSVQLRTELPRANTTRLEATHVAGTTVLLGAACSIALLPGVITIYPSPLGLVLVAFGAIVLSAGLFVD
ncbi:hypothetical protein L593_09950 [Salinarchaeum sp. Harcht-Bsk1]|uniref:DUF7519 family protein n=1 Tax=Salinarchaeum sp. Harcht-Bsk1 TaxID=1333523 RepID=UPI00034242E5|nr:hypothetical protein [Salinarchaeum sp. Harcht-Bsk1]AGN01935.1 hypothetical protein L593_09950 [Salinarchaeum sp. Harcht-Bsk1]